MMNNMSVINRIEFTCLFIAFQTVSSFIIQTPRSFSTAMQAETFVTEANTEIQVEIGNDAIDKFASSNNPQLDQPLSSFDDPEFQSIINENTKMHMDSVRKSEATFYGFYSPDGFLDFDYDKCPEEWVSYSVDEHYTKQSINVENKHELESGRNSVSPTKNIWDALLQLDQHVIPPPFSTPNDLARVSQTPILSPDECSELISDCESHYYGWGSSHERYGTPKENVGYMIKLEDLSRSYSLVNFELLPRLFPAIMNAFPKLKTSPKNFRLGGCRIVKYDAADGHVELGLHRDGLFITANIALNNLDDYEGGGTYVEGLRDFMNNPIRLPKGHVMIHPGDVLHGGAPITKGVRYVLVCFILDTTIIPHEKHCQDRMQKDIEAARSIPSSDVLRAEERMQLLASATKNCADAYAFGKLAVCGERCNGYDDIVQNFERFVVAQDVASATALNAFQKVEMSEVEIA